MTKNDMANGKIKSAILETIQKEKQTTTQQLITIINEKYKITREEIADILIELENENKLNFITTKQSIPTSVKAYVLSKTAAWYWIIFALSLITTITVFIIPGDVYPLVYVRLVLGLTFVSFIPGYAFIKALFPAKITVRPNSETMGIIEIVILSLVMSFILTSLTGLVLNYTPWGIRLTPITLCLLVSTLILATIALFREYQHNQNKNANVRYNMDF